MRRFLMSSLPKPKRFSNLPEVLRDFFDSPPLLAAERRDHYNKLLFAVAEAVQPTDSILWINVKEYTDICWELERERQVKARMITLMQDEIRRKASSPALTRADFERAKMLKAEGFKSSLFKKKNPEAEAKVEPSADAAELAEVYKLCHREIDIIDTRIASYVFRRHAVLREIDRYSESLARRLINAVSSIIDGELAAE
jgi:hypothetical protein